TRIVIDKNLGIPAHYHIFNDAAKTIIFNEVKTAVVDNIHFVQMEDMHFYLPQKIAYQLYLMDIQSVIIEGGANILSQFIAANLWDEARIFTSKTEWKKGLEAPKIIGNILEDITIGDDNLKILKR
ncbi:MAG: riboflavin biosynthesis protein RibD, partial [Pedobacter sp.]